MPTIATTKDLLVVAPRGSVQQAQDYIAPHNPQRPAFLADYLATLWTVCVQVPLDFALLVAQAIEETEFFSSSWWVSRGNPAGMGITGDTVQDADSPVFATAAAAARAHAAHILLYCSGQISGGSGLLPADDPRYQAYVDAHGHTALVMKLGDLGSGNWAADPSYAVNITPYASGIINTPIVAPSPGSVAPGGNPVPALNMKKDLIPLPPFINDIITDAENNAWDVLGPKVVDRFILHRQLGDNDGTRLWFRRGAASTGLTEFGQARAGGQLYLWNSPLGFAQKGVTANRAPWASGVYNVHGDAWGDGPPWVNKYGLNAVNGMAAAWEIDGQYGDPWEDAAQQEAAQACAHYAHNKGIAWSDFPMVVADGCSFVLWHQELTGPAEKICPGPVVMNATPAWIERVRAILKAAQTGGVPMPPAPVPPVPAYAAPIKPTGVSASFLPYVATLTVIKPYQPLQYANAAAPATAAEFPVTDPKTGKPTVVNVKWLDIGEDGKGYFVSSGGSRHPAWAFFPTTGVQK